MGFNRCQMHEALENKVSVLFRRRAQRAGEAFLWHEKPHELIHGVMVPGLWGQTLPLVGAQVQLEVAARLAGSLLEEAC